jgi:phosphoribosylaminoimidazole-succinocarboxamide synthase
MPIILSEAHLPLPLFRRGKVRDTFDLGGKLLIVSTDRLSAFDVVLPSLIPDKGVVLNQLSCFWFEKTSRLVPNHLIARVDTTAPLKGYFPNRTTPPEYLIGRSMITMKAERIPVECVVRGYISGSAWEEYKQTGTISGVPTPAGLHESEQLSHPIFTPTTKAESGHDQPLSMKELTQLVGKRTADALEEKSLSLYQFARDYSLSRDIIVADTKFEFGLVDRKLIVIDELLTPDSSRFWDAAKYSLGRSQPSFDKQPVRDWLVASGWNKQPPAPVLPPEIVEATSQRYREAYYRITGRTFPNVPG